MTLWSGSDTNCAFCAVSQNALRSKHFYNPSVKNQKLFDSSLRRARSAALICHRHIIHYRRLRFAYPLHKGAFEAVAIQTLRFDDWRVL